SGGRGISGRSTSYSVTASWRAPSDTSELRSTTLWRLPNRPRCSPLGLVAVAGPGGRTSIAAIRRWRGVALIDPLLPAGLLRRFYVLCQCIRKTEFDPARLTNPVLR